MAQNAKANDDAQTTTELDYETRTALSEGETATLVYENVYSGTTVEKEVVVLDTTGNVTVETDDGTEWGVFRSSVRTTVNNRRQSGTTDAKNGRLLGYLVALEQDDDEDDEEAEVRADGGQVLDLPDYGNVADYAEDVDLSEFSDDDLLDLDDRLSDMLNGDPYAFPSDEELQAAFDLSAAIREEQRDRDPRRDDPHFTPHDSEDRYEVEITSVEVERTPATTYVRIRLDDDYAGDVDEWTTRPGLDIARLVRDYLGLDDLRAIGTAIGQTIPVVGADDGDGWARLDRYALNHGGITALDVDEDSPEVETDGGVQGATDEEVREAVEAVEDSDDSPELVTDGGVVVEGENDYDADDARQVLYEGYGESYGEEAVEVADLAGLHDGATTFLALFDQTTGDEFEVPDDLDGDTKRQLQTARTLLSRALNGMEQTAADRLNALDDEEEA